MSAPMRSAKEDCEHILDMMVPFVKHTLQKYGEYYPVAGAMTCDGEIGLVATHDGNDRPLSANVIRELKRILIAEARAGRYIATALAYDVRVTHPDTNVVSDAIACNLDHEDGYSVIVFFPYKLIDGVIVDGEAFVNGGEADIFSQQK